VGALPRPDVPTGAARQLFDELHDLHHRAGWPSLRTMAREIGCSHTTVSVVFSGPRVPRWGLLELIVETLGGDALRMRQLWLAASDPGCPDQGGDGAGPGPRQLPPDVAGFAGRTGPLGDLDRLLVSPVTGPPATVVAAVSGPAGVGKTTLVVHWAHRVADRFPDGQLYVDLRGFDPDRPAVDPAEAIRGFLDALGVPAGRIPADPDAQAGLYRSAIAGRRILVVADNARDAAQVRPLLPGGPTALVIVTSRSHLPGLVAAGARPVILDVFSVDESRTLLTNRLGADRLAAEPHAAEHVIARCGRLPLALAIAAARAATQPTIPLAALAEDLHDSRDRLDALSGGDPTADLRAVFASSYRILNPAAADLFRLLGLHPGPEFSTGSAASLAGVAPRRARQTLAELNRAHLIVERVPGRYTVHDLLRAYARELALLRDADAERGHAIHRVLDHFVHSAFAAARAVNPTRDPISVDGPRPGVSPDQLDTLERAMAWFSAERTALLAAIGHAARIGSDRHTWQLAWTLTDFLERRGRWRTQITVQQAALAAARRLADPTMQAAAHRVLGSTHRQMGRHDEAHDHLRRALDLYRYAGDIVGQARSHHDLAELHDRQSHHRDAVDHAQRALDLYRAIDHVAGVAYGLNNLGWYQCQLGHHRQALASCRQALARHQANGNRLGQACTWDSLGYAQHHLGDHTSAADCYRHALVLYRDLGDRYHEATTLDHLGATQDAVGDPAARATWRRALAILDELEHPDGDAVRAKLR
jgi:tetratricopeptide (TPR) repeat protein